MAAVGHVADIPLRLGDRILLGLAEEVAAARDRTVHLGAAHLFERHLFADHHLGHAGRSEVHRSVALHHEDDVAEGGYVGAAGCTGAEEQANLRDQAGEFHLVVEDPTGVAAAREHLDLIGDPGAGGVDEVEEGNPQPLGGLLDPQDLLHRAGAPGAGLDRRVVGHDCHGAAIDPAHAGHDAIRRQVRGLVVRKEPIFNEGALVYQEADPLPHEELAVAGGLLVVLRGAPPLDLRLFRLQLFLQIHSIHSGLPPDEGAGSHTRPRDYRSALMALSISSMPSCSAFSARPRQSATGRRTSSTPVPGKGSSSSASASAAVTRS